MFWSHSFVADRCIDSSLEISLKVVVNLYNVFIVTLFAVTCSRRRFNLSWQLMSCLYFLVCRLHFCPGAARFGQLSA